MKPNVSALSAQRIDDSSRHENAPIGRMIVTLLLAANVNQGGVAAEARANSHARSNKERPAKPETTLKRTAKDEAGELDRLIGRLMLRANANSAPNDRAKRRESREMMRRR